MKKLYILGNWKSNKTIEHAQAWKQQFEQYVLPQDDRFTVIVCPAFHHLAVFAGNHTSYALGAQDLSPFEAGAYTGEVAASMMKDMVEYVMVGHSERRTHFGETDEIVVQKVKQALSAGIKPVVCISDAAQASRIKELAPEFEASGFLLYEPVFAIGSGTADTSENANATAEGILRILPSVPVLYGGSVSSDNVKGFVRQPNISGVGVGGASLDPQKFSALIAAAVS